MSLNANSFSKCAPALSTNIKQCGSVALCNLQPLTTGDLTDAYMKSGEYRVMEALLLADMEIKQCGETQAGLFDFLMANKVNMSKRVVAHGRESGLLQIAPFIKARQYSPINNEYWIFTEGSSAGAGDWAVTVTTGGNVPADVRSFPVGINVYLNGAGEGGAATRTAYKVLAVTDNSDDTLTLNLTALNSNSNLEAAKIANPVSGYLTRGGNNVSDYEKDCAEMPAYLNKKLVPFWVKTTRWSMCKSSKYDQYRQLAMENNVLFREFGDVPEAEKNRQLAADFQKRWTQDFFWGKALPNQNLADYDQLDDIQTFLDETSNLGVDGDVCVGKRAEPVGVYEQMAECGRVVDLLGEALNLPALFEAFYHIIRVRTSQNDNNRIIDVFTDTRTAELINRAMWQYYSSKITNSDGDSILRANRSVEGPTSSKKAEFGFIYRSYELDWPAGVTMNVITHYAFDDELSVAQDAGVADTARRLWVLNFANIYPGIIASNRVVQNTGDLKTLASVNPDFACVMKVHTRQQTLNSVTFTTVLECPSGNLIIENFSDEIPSIVEQEGLAYPSGTTTTTGA